MPPLIDLKGQQFGRWVVIGRAGSTKGKDATWLCRCACGTAKVVVGISLRSGLSKSCGCLNSELARERGTIDMISKRYGKLLIISRAENDKHGQARWLCRCDCGEQVIRPGSKLRNGDSKSCGCVRHEKALLARLARPKGEAAFGALVNRMKGSAKRRGYRWALTKEQVRILTKQPCHYCGVEPQQIVNYPYGHGQYVYNGLDRVLNNVGYIPENVVPCCGICNVAKSTRTVEEFTAWAHRLSKHLVKIQP